MNTQRINVGDAGTFHGAAGLANGPVRATVTHVWTDSCVNLQTDSGLQHTSVLVVRNPQPGAAPQGYYFVPDALEVAKPSVIPEIKASIKGYRQLSAEEQALINEGKDLAEKCGAWIAKLRTHPQAKPEQAPTNNDCLVPLDQRWISIGATDLQRGFMAAIRGIAQPTTF